MQWSSDIAAPPTALVIESVGLCNLRCPHCAIGTGMTSRSKRLFPLALFHRLCNEVRGHIRHVYLHLWGEPTMHPSLGEMIDRAREFAVVDVATNGTLVTPEIARAVARAQTISVSIEGLDQETYERYRVGGRVEDAMRGLRLLAEAAPGRVNWTWIAWRWNEHQIPPARELAASLGVRFGVKPPYLLHEGEGEADLPVGVDIASRYVKGDDGHLRLKANRHACREFWKTAYVLPDGTCLTCCYDFMGRWPVGNVADKPLADVWNGETYRTLRRDHLAGALHPMCRSECRLP